MSSGTCNIGAAARRTVLFSGHDFRFLRPFIAHCEQSPQYDLFFEEHRGHEGGDPARCGELLKTADIIFCEWCLGNAVWYSHNKLPGQRLVVRLHAQEMRLPFLDRVRWENVDALILICPRNRDLILQQYPFLRDKTRLVYNPINATALGQPKLPGAEFNLGIMGICPMLKAPHLAFEIFARLKRRDRRFTLFLKGKHPRDYDWLWKRPSERAYYEKLFSDIAGSPFADSVVFETYGEDVPVWFSKVGFVLSTSDAEGSHQAVAEGMASGAIPVIRNWPGADHLYPGRYIFSTVDEAVRAVWEWKTPVAYGPETARCREYAREHFDETRVCAQLESLLYPEPLRGQSLAVDIGNRAIARTKVMLLGFLPPGCGGGYRIRIEQEIKALAKRGCEVHLACLHPPEAEPGALLAHRDDLQALGCVVHTVPVPRFFEIGLAEDRLRAELALLEGIARANEIRLVHAEALYSARVGLLLKWRCPELKLVFDCHGAAPEEETMTGAHSSRIRAMQEWERMVLAESDLNVFVSGAMRDFYKEKYGFRELRHCVVPCCVASDRFEGGSPMPPGVNPPSDRPVIAYLGTLAAWQCGEEMMRLFGQLYRFDHRLFFLLIVPRGDHPKARELMQRHGLPPGNVVLTELPHREVAKVLPRAHLGVLLRREHPVNRVSSPTKFGEYLAAGVPVVMTGGIGDFSALATERNVGLVLENRFLEDAAFSDQDVARILEFLGESMELRAEVGARCRQIAREMLLWDSLAPVLVERYCELCEDGALAGGNAAEANHALAASLGPRLQGAYAGNT